MRPLTCHSSPSGHTPPPRQDSAVGLLVGAAAAFAVLYLVFVRTPAGQVVDETAMRWIAATAGSPAWADAVLESVSGPTVTAAALVIAAVTAAVGRRAPAVLGLAVAASVLLAAEVLKAALGRPELLVNPTVNSLPSGHVAAVGGVMAALVLAVPPARRRLITAVVAAVPATLLTGLATVVVQWHRPSDVLASVCLSVAAATAGSLLLQRLDCDREVAAGADADPAVDDHRDATPGHRASAALVVLAGLPGAGKTTLLRKLAAADEVDALDSEDVAQSLAGLPVPYRALRPLVHTTHLLRVLVAALVDRRGVLLTSDPMTSATRRLFFRSVALVARRRLVVVLVHVEPAQARDGQVRRGRTLSRRRMRRHERRYDALLSSPPRNTVVLDRRSAAEATCLTDVLHPRSVLDRFARPFTLTA